MFSNHRHNNYGQRGPTGPRGPSGGTGPEGERGPRGERGWTLLMDGEGENINHTGRFISVVDYQMTQNLPSGGQEDAVDVDSGDSFRFHTVNENLWLDCTDHDASIHHGSLHAITAEELQTFDSDDTPRCITTLAVSSNGTTILVADPSNGIQVTKDGGATWTLQDGDQLAGLTFPQGSAHVLLSSNGLKAVCTFSRRNTGKVYYASRATESEFFTWLEYDDVLIGEEVNNFTALVKSSDDAHLVLLSSNRRVYYSSDFGETWTFGDFISPYTDNWVDASVDTDGRAVIISTAGNVLNFNVATMTDSSTVIDYSHVLRGRLSLSACHIVPDTHYIAVASDDTIFLLKEDVTYRSKKLPIGGITTITSNPDKLICVGLEGIVTIDRSSFTYTRVFNTHGAWRCIDSYMDGDTTTYLLGGNYVFGWDNEGIIIRDTLEKQTPSDEASVFLQPGQDLELVYVGDNTYAPVVHSATAPILFYPGTFNFEELVKND